ARSTRGPSVTEAVPPDERLQLLEDRPAFGGVERRRVPDMMERAVRIVEAEEQRPDAATILGDSVAPDHAVDGAQVLDLDPAPLSGAVRTGRVLRDHAVEPAPS